MLGDVYTREYRKIPTIIAKAVKTAELTNTSLTPYQTTSAVLRQPKESLSSSFFSIDDCTKETRSPKQSGKNSAPKLRRIGYQKMNGRNDVWLRTDPVVVNQAAFLAADSHGTITPGEPMKSGALNPHLREGCIDAGLPQRNTMYCFRRTRTIETKHEHGETAARAIAAHADDSNAHEYYDTVGVGDIDIQSYILGRERASQGAALEKHLGILTSDLQMSRREARKMFEQAARTGYVQHGNYEITLRAEVEERLRKREREHLEVVE
ncbi:uncharacterized protein J4E79_009643 [Alternaria viburni]|uniref:uncharacterized protein n=1 Tax=Alternaria viburni TaxID=566460 RepID=UPI0020C3D190|nr:uncharacterized protein J4E79_009643 [Alternaria viburni]KAI4649798.1 hypothetical protein J4E79_009643 [Alternaria viburni]